MKQRSMFVFCLMLVSAVFAAAQNRPVTNADLEKYRQVREKAEGEYRQNYARLGLLSPEELDLRREKEQAAAEKLSAELRESRLERERVEAERQAYTRREVYFQNVPVERGYQEYGFQYYWPANRRHWYPVRQPYTQPGYYAGGQFWPTPVRTPSRRPVWIRPR